MKLWQYYYEIMANYYEIMKILGLGEDKINKNGLKKKGKCEAIFFLKI